MEQHKIFKIQLKIPIELLKEQEQKEQKEHLYNINTHSISINATEIDIQLPIYLYTNYINPKDFSLENLPTNLTISTISATGKINCKTLLSNMWQYMKLHTDSILTIMYDGKVRSLLKAPFTKKKKRCFVNQITMEIRVNTEKKINIKIFRNGSFQMSGCKSIDDCNIILNKLITRLKTTLAIRENDKFVDVPFLEDLTDEEIRVHGFKIDMINSNFSVGYNINRDSLFNILKNKNVNCRYEPLIHACVNIKLPKYDNDLNIKTPSIFVFQSGNIIITGARNKDQIINSYNYIMTILNENYDKIVKKDIMNILDSSDIKEILEELEILHAEEKEKELDIIDDDNIIV